MSIMDAEEIEGLSDTWETVERDLESNGIKLFINLFTYHPDVQTRYFPNFDINDLAKLRTHGGKVMRDVGMLVQFVKDAESDNLIAKINRITETHYGRGIKHAKVYEVLKNIILMTLEEALGPKMTPKAKRAWDILLTTLVMEKEIKRIESQGRAP